MKMISSHMSAGDIIADGHVSAYAGRCSPDVSNFYHGYDEVMDTYMTDKMALPRKGLPRCHGRARLRAACLFFMMHS